MTREKLEADISALGHDLNDGMLVHHRMHSCVCVCVCVNHQFPDLGFKLEMEEARQKRRDAEK